MTRSKKIVNGYEYEVNTDEVCYMPRTKVERYKLLREFFFNKMEDRWRRIPKQQAALERQFSKELFNSIQK